jgi:hypothetical protein
VRAFFKSVLDDLENPKTPPVCMLSGSLCSEIFAERELGRIVVNDMRAFTAAFIQRLESAKKAGELAAGFDATVAAQVMVTYLQGLFRVVRVLQDRAEIDRQIEMLLNGLGL